MDAPLTSERKSFLPMRLRSTTVVGSSNIPAIARPSTPVSTPMQLSSTNDMKSSLTVGNRVLVNGLKIGTLRYIGRVQFAHGLFYGVELDEPDGKHDGQVDNIRYFQCPSNHGVFVPFDKIAPAPRERSSSSHRTVSRLKPPGITRSMTITSSIHRIEPAPIRNPPVPTPALVSPPSPPPKHMQLPDIIPTPLVSPIVPIVEKQEKIPIVKETIINPIQIQTSMMEETTETLDAVFIDSVSSILHQLQQEPKPILLEPRVSVTISEEGTIDDDDDDDKEDDDDDDSGSITEPIVEDKSNKEIKRNIPTNLPAASRSNPTIVKPNVSNLQTLSISNKSLASSTTSVNKLKTNRPSIPETKTSAPNPPVKKDPPSKPSISRRLSLIPPKPSIAPTTSAVKPNILRSLHSMGSRSKLNSSSTSISTTQSDVTSISKKPVTKRTSEPLCTLSTRSEKKVDSSSSSTRVSLETFEHQLMIDKVLIQSLEVTNDRLKKEYHHLLNRFDVMTHLTQFYISENERLHDDYQIRLRRNQTNRYRLKTAIEQLRLTHQQELFNHAEQHQKELDRLKDFYQQELSKSHQEIDQFLKTKEEMETRCSALQQRVDGFLEEMANSEHADLLLTHVDKLEKDRTSLETVLELKNQELTQLRTKMNEQVFQREDQMALQKRIDMAENRNQDLVCLLRQWQLNEKAVVVECDQLKEKIAQIERDNRQLTFENEILLYRVRHRSPTSSVLNTFEHSNSTDAQQQQEPRTRRASSCSSLAMIVHDENASMTRCLSLRAISNR